MNKIPLEVYVSYIFNISVEGVDVSNMPNGKHQFIRMEMSKEHFAPLIEIYKDVREEVESFSNVEDGLAFLSIGKQNNLIGSALAYIDNIESLYCGAVNITESITPELIRAVQSLHQHSDDIIKLADCIAILTVHMDNPDQHDFVKANVGHVLREIKSKYTPTPLDTVCGNGKIARLLRNAFKNSTLFSQQSEKDAVKNSLTEMEINEKFNLHPNCNLLSTEWKNIIRTLIHLQSTFLANEAPVDLFKKITSNHILSESGLYLVDGTDRLIAFVFELDNVSITITIKEEGEPTIHCHHKWENQQVNIYGICYFPGMLDKIYIDIENMLPETVLKDRTQAK